MKEYEIVSIIDGGAYSNTFSKSLEMVGSSIPYKNYVMLDLAAARAKVEEVFKAIELMKRYDTLRVTSKFKLRYDPSGFIIDDHKFETLDEVDVALNNKAFL
jgi:hypothetical protein